MPFPGWAVTRPTGNQVPAGMGMAITMAAYGLILIRLTMSHGQPFIP